jgi:hypothetical protein
MKSGGRGSSSGGARTAVRRALVVAQVSLSLVLLFGALLFVGTFRNLLSSTPASGAITCSSRSST